MLVYHGTRISKVAELLAADGLYSRRPGLFVTDTPERATRYANAQATRTVTTAYAPLAQHAAILTIEVDDEPTWTRRPENHGSLDMCEATIKQGRIVAITAQECDYANCTCHRAAPTGAR